VTKNNANSICYATRRLSARGTIRLSALIRRHLKASEKDYKRSDSGGLFMLVTTTGSKLGCFGDRFDSKQKLLALGQ